MRGDDLGVHIEVIAPIVEVALENALNPLSTQARSLLCLMASLSLMNSRTAPIPTFTLKRRGL